MATNTIKTRIQLKSDTEANWKQAVLNTDNPEGTKSTGSSFKPKMGEAIIFSSDSTHPFSRLKIGNENTDVLSLPFIDAGSLDGHPLSYFKIAQEEITDPLVISNTTAISFISNISQNTNGEITAIKADIPIASNNNLGLIKIGNNLTINNGVVSVSVASNNLIGGIKLGYSTSGKNYAVQLSNEQAYVNVPWENTTYGVVNNGGLTVVDAGQGSNVDRVFSHSNNITASDTYSQDSNLPLNFGSSFTIPQINYDNHGHITSIYTNTLTLPTAIDTKVKQNLTASTDTKWYAGIFTKTIQSDSDSFLGTNDETNEVNYLTTIAAQPSTGTLRAKVLRVENKVALKWNSSDNSLDFEFLS